MGAVAAFRGVPLGRFLIEFTHALMVTEAVSQRGLERGRVARCD